MRVARVRRDPHSHADGLSGQFGQRTLSPKLCGPPWRGRVSVSGWPEVGASESTFPRCVLLGASIRRGWRPAALSAELRLPVGVYEHFSPGSHQHVDASPSESCTAKRFSGLGQANTCLLQATNGCGRSRADQAAFGALSSCVSPLEPLNASSSWRPIASPSGIGTAFPICRAISSRVPTHLYVSGKPWIRAAS